VRTRLALVFSAAVTAGSLAPSAALAADPPADAPPPDTAAPAPADTNVLPPDAHIDFAATPPEGKTPEEAAPVLGPEGLIEAPPPRPHKKGLVLEAGLGVLGFAGQFKHVAPPGYWLHAQLGYEVLDWLMFFGEGELAFTDTGEAQSPSHQIAFPIWGFGGGARFTLHATPRVAFFAQGQVGALEADVPHNALLLLGFRNAESLGVSFGGRLGVEWYQLDRHLALDAQVGVRDASGFAKVTSNDTALMWDASLGVRYTF